MLPKSIIDGIYSIFFTMEPFQRQIRHLIITLEVLGDARNGLHAQLGHFEVVAVTATRNGLQNLVKVLLGGFDLFGIVGLKSTVDFTF
mgnify:CR=1 FL=1